MEISEESRTFDEFIAVLDTNVASTFRGLKKSTPVGNFAISARFTKRIDNLGPRCELFLNNDVEYVHAITSVAAVTPSDFYKGINLGWSGVEQGLDVKRRLCQTILLEHFFETQELDKAQFLVIKAYAGAGKTILLHRIAWDAAHDLDKICLFLRPDGVIDPVALSEIIELCKERVFLFVDAAPHRVGELARLFRDIGTSGRFLTVVTAARTNEWNITGSPLSTHVTAQYELGYLSDTEIDQLLTLLETHNPLGTLRKLDQKVRRQELSERAGRQLLVALHEATFGKSFVEIIKDEFDSIRPGEAQDIYLTICILNRLDVPVRAGIVSRLHNVSFEEFRTRFFAPLELVVQAAFDRKSRDNIYTARHSHIAQIVFEEVLTDQEEKFLRFRECLSSLNIDFSTDRRAFRAMVRAKPLMETFSDSRFIELIYTTACESIGDDVHLFHQMAIYEMQRDNGDLMQASVLLRKASEIHVDRAILHSMAELELVLAERASTALEGERHLRNAYVASSRLMEKATDAHPFHTAIKVHLYRIKWTLQSGTASVDEDVENYVKQAEKTLDEGYQRFPDDSYLKAAEADLATLISDSSRAMEALEQAFAGNNKNAYVASRLARVYLKRGELPKALDILKKALNARPTDKRLHYDYARALIDVEAADADEVVYHLRNAYSPGDHNFDAQLLHAREMYKKGETDECGALLSKMSNVAVPWEQKVIIHYPLSGVFSGSVSRIEASYCSLVRDGIGDELFAYWRDFVSEEDWRRLLMTSRVSFRIGFTMKGVRAFEVQVL